MKNVIQSPDNIDGRIELVAEETNLTRSQMAEERLSVERSLAWQQRWVAGVNAGIEDADRGDFATDDEIAGILTRYDQA